MNYEPELKVIQLFIAVAKTTTVRVSLSDRKQFPSNLNNPYAGNSTNQ